MQECWAESRGSLDSSRFAKHLPGWQSGSGDGAARHDELWQRMGNGLVPAEGRVYRQSGRHSKWSVPKVCDVSQEAGQVAYKAQGFTWQMPDPKTSPQREAQTHLLSFMLSNMGTGAPVWGEDRLGDTQRSRG